MITGRKLIEYLSQCKNLDSVVCLCVDNYPYAEIKNISDRSTLPESDGNIGNILLTVHNSDILKVLEKME